MVGVLELFSMKRGDHSVTCLLQLMTEYGVGARGSSMEAGSDLFMDVTCVCLGEMVLVLVCTCSPNVGWQLPLLNTHQCSCA